MVCKLSDLKEAVKGTEKSLYESSLQLKNDSDGHRGGIVGHLSCSINYTLVQFDKWDWGEPCQSDIILFSNNTGEMLTHLDLDVIEDGAFGNLNHTQLSRSWLAQKVGFTISNIH